MYVVLEVFEEAVVALGDGGEGVLFLFLLLPFLFHLGRGGGALADQFFPEDVELQAPFPKFIGGGAVGGPVHAGAVDFVGLLGGEVKREGEASLDPGQPFADPVVEAGEDFIGRGDVAALGQLGKDRRQEQEARTGGKDRRQGQEARTEGNTGGKDLS